MRNTSDFDSQPAARRFGRFELRPTERVLLDDGAPVALGTRAFDLLVAFSERPGALITKDELLETVWAGLVVEENNLQVQVSTLRKILGQGALVTIPGRGYRFSLPVARDGSREKTLRDRDEAIDPTPAATVKSRTNLPARAPLLYGRDDDVMAIGALLREHTVVTITGAGGIGKTRVAQAIAQRVLTEREADYPDGIWWIELAALADDALVPSAVAHAIGRGNALESPSARALATMLATSRALLILDNCEHLAEGVAALVDALGTGAPAMSLLVTSQETLRAADEHVYRLGGLAIPDATDVDGAKRTGAIALFEARARGADPRFALTPGNFAAAIEICRRLDGIPLAIELAAARLPLLGVEGLRARLSERFNLLTGGARVVLRRHQTLRAMLDWSHALLTADEQTVFRRLGVFAGGFTLEAAQHVASDERIDAWTALDHLGALVDKSLVLADGDPIPRYRMLETARAYALERLAEAGEMDTILRRHAVAMLALLAPFEHYEWRWRASGTGPSEAKAELDNMRAALEWADARDPALAVALAGVSYSVWWSSSYLAEGLARSLALRRHVDDSVPAAAAARFWLTIAKLGVYSTRPESRAAAVRAVSLYRSLADEQRLFEALTFAAVQGARFATLDEMKAQIDEAARLERPDWPARQRAKLEFARCFWLARQHRFEEALGCALRQVAVCREEGVESAALYATSNVTLMLALAGRASEALEQARAAIARLHDLDDDTRAGHLHYSETIALILLDRVADALTAARNAYSRLVHEGDHYRMVLPLALIAVHEGRSVAASRLVAFDEAVRRRTGENESAVAPLLLARLESLLREAVSPGERAHLAAEGAALSDGDAFALAFGERAPAAGGAMP